MKTNQLIFSVIYVLSAAFILSSCTKELPQHESNPDDVLLMSDLQVDQDFEFKTTQAISLKIVSSDYLGLPATKIEVFNGNPNDNGQIFKSGITNREQIFEAQFEAPTSLSQLYVRRTTFDGSVETVTLDITSELVEYTFIQLKSSGAFKGTTAGPGCENCDNVVTETEGKLSVDDGETYCILYGSTFEGEVDLDGGTLTVCGTLILEKIKGEGTIIINDDGVFEAEDLDLSKKEMIVINHSQAFDVEESAITGVLENYGTMNFEKLDIGASGSLHNYEGGTVNVSKDFVNLNSTINDGTIIVLEKLEHTNGIFENNCRLIIKEDLEINSEFRNNSYIQIYEKLDMSSGPLVLSNQSIIETKDLDVNAAINVIGDLYCKIIVSDESDISSSADFSGKLSYYDENGIENDDGDYGDDVTFDNAYIPATYCSPGSNLEGGVVVVDSDDDGVSDGLDDNPTDGSVAFDNYYPSENNYGTLVFEDLWPYQGDFDFNDLVVDYQFNQKTNASDFVVEIGVKLKVRAIGAAFKNGFGIQLPVSSSAIASVTGDFSHTTALVNSNANNTESNQAKAVIVFFDNAFDLLPHPGVSTGVNTTEGAPYVTPIEINFVITLTYPVASDVLGTPLYNAFIFANGSRGREIHLKNNAPTDLADTQYFGIGSDVSNTAAGVYYQTENGLPWALNIVESFDYPTEKSDMVNAYLHFAEWAMSGGTTYTDWYSNSAGYRNTTLIY